MKKSGIVLAIFLLTRFLLGASPAETYEQTVEALAPLDGEWLTPIPTVSPETAASVKLVHSQEANRKTASDRNDQEFYESKMSPEYKTFRTEFFAIRTAEDLDQELTKLDLTYDKLPDSATDLKFIAAQIIPLRVLRGMVWRLIPPMESSKVTHSMILTQVKNLAVNARIFFPTAQWDAGVDYLTQPFVQNGVPPFSPKGQMIEQFPGPGKSKTVEAPIQAYVISTIIPALQRAALRIESIDMTKGEFVWDNKLLYGTGTFPDALNRYALMTEVERQSALATMYSGLSNLAAQAAYSWNGSLALNRDIGRLYGFDAFIGQVDGVPAAKTVKTIRGYTDWGLLFEAKNYGFDIMNRSWGYLENAVAHGDQAWQLMKGRAVSEMYLIDTSRALPFQRQGNARLDNLKEMVKGPRRIRSEVTGDTVLVDLPAWYHNPVHDLKKLYATGFDGSPEFISDKQVQNGAQKVTLPPYRNYLRGRSAAWDLSIYKTLLPEISSDRGLKDAARILSQGWSGSQIAAPLANYLN